MEMLVVVGIIGLITAISVPSVSAGIDSVRINSATGSIASFLNSALNQAERRQTAVEVTISVKENRLTAYSAEPGFRRELQLPDGIRIEALLPHFDNEEPVRRLLLLPGDTAPAIGIQLSNRHGAHRLVHLDPMTGFPRVQRVEPQ